MDLNPYEAPISHESHPGPTPSKVRKAFWIPVAAFFGGTIVAVWVTGRFYKQAIGNAEPDLDGAMVGATCLFCPLVGLLVALIVERLMKR